LISNVATAKRERASTIRYFDASAIVAALVENDQDAQDSMQADGVRAASALTFAESDRAISRACREGRLSAANGEKAIRGLLMFEGQADIVFVSAPILARSRRPFPVEPVRTVDAIHLATAESLDLHPSFLTFVTRDKRLRENAQALGYAVE
jgi:predicted nucleic acid-binding protein